MSSANVSEDTGARWVCGSCCKTTIQAVGNDAPLRCVWCDAPFPPSDSRAEPAPSVATHLLDLAKSDADLSQVDDIMLVMVGACAAALSSVMAGLARKCTDEAAKRLRKELVPR